MDKLKINTLYKGDSIVLMEGIEDGSVDVVLTDPPYKYLNHKLEEDYDEQKFVQHCKRILKPEGFIVIFGRGTSFYRINTILSDHGFTFKEEVIWDKSMISSPLQSLSRVHETVSIHTKGNGKINKCRAPYIEMKKHDIPSIIQDLKRITSGLKNIESLNKVINFLEGEYVFDGVLNSNPNFTNISSNIKNQDRSISTLKSINEGLIEKSIIKNVRDHYTSIHPTQKPVRLLERILNLVATKGMVCVDPFSGSCSTIEACINLCINYIGIEKDEEYFGLGKARIDKIDKKLF